MAPRYSQDKSKTPQVLSMRPQSPGPANLSTLASYHTPLTLYPSPAGLPPDPYRPPVLRPQALAVPSAGSALPFRLGLTHSSHPSDLGSSVTYTCGLQAGPAHISPREAALVAPGPSDPCSNFTFAHGTI